MAECDFCYNWYEWLVRLEMGHTRPGQPIWTSGSIPSGMLSYWSHVGWQYIGWMLPAVRIFNSQVIKAVQAKEGLRSFHCSHFFKKKERPHNNKYHISNRLTTYVKKKTIFLYSPMSHCHFRLKTKKEKLERNFES